MESKIQSFQLVVPIYLGTNISSDDGEDLFADDRELLVQYIRKWEARYEVEEQENEKHEIKENSRTALGGKFIT